MFAVEGTDVIQRYTSQSWTRILTTAREGVRLREREGRKRNERRENAELHHEGVGAQDLDVHILGRALLFRYRHRHPGPEQRVCPQSRSTLRAYACGSVMLAGSLVLFTMRSGLVTCGTTCKIGLVVAA